MERHFNRIRAEGCAIERFIGANTGDGKFNIFEEG
jgi:hypothetical protein